MYKFCQFTLSHCKGAQQGEGVCRCCSRVSRGTTWPKSPKMILQGHAANTPGISVAKGICCQGLLFHQPVACAWPVPSSSVNFLGDLMSHGTQDRRAQRYFHIGALSPLVSSPAFFILFSFLHFASQYPAQMNSCSFCTPFFHFHNHNAQPFRFRSCLSHFPHTLPSARWPLNTTQ